MQRIGVAIVHGIEIADPDFAATPTKLLYEGFREVMGPNGPDPEEALVVKPIHWAPELEDRQRELFAQVYDESNEPGVFFDERVRPTVERLNAGERMQLFPMMLSIADRTRGDLRQLNWPAARWLMMHFIGDVIAYDSPYSGTNYRAIHARFAAGLAELADEVGDEAPLCVIAHSLGSVLASDYFYDQQTRHLWKEVRAAQGSSALAKGQTLAWMYTMGSPLALWSLKYPSTSQQLPGDEPKMSKPIEVPVHQIAQRYPELNTEWINFYDKDDIIAYPLEGLSEEYANVVDDRDVRVHTFPFSWTPLTHSFYWADRVVMDPIAQTLATGWQHLN